MKEFFESNFNHLILEEKEPISKSFDRGHTLYIIGFENTGDKYHIIAAIMYIKSPEGAYINWFAVSNSDYDKNRFGKLANGKPF